MNELLDNHAPFKKVSKCHLKLKNKSVVEAVIYKSISVKNSLFNKCIKLKDPVKKTKTRDKYKY